MLGRIPVLANLSKRGVRVNSVNCIFCSRDIEEVDHSFFNCDFAKKVWRWLWNWAGWLSGIPQNFESLLNIASDLKQDKMKLKLFWTLSYGTLWELWKGRNEHIFRKKKAIEMKVAEHIQINTYNWVKYRGRLQDLNWHSW